jgi:aspartyl-tRNA(Asn)/glutamyl-tRNA(Gln) amidotransferase subunit B
LNQQGKTIEEFPISPEKLAELIAMIDAGKVSNTLASQKLFPALLEDAEKSPQAIAEALNLIQDSDEGSIKGFIDEVIKQHPSEVERYRGGEKQLVGFFMGQLMKVSKGKADPKAANKLMREKLEN